MNELALFAGAGGGILGGKILGWRTVCAVEWDAYARDVLVARQNDGSLEPFPIWDDIQTFDGRPWRGRVDVVSGGFPCQDISSAGKGAGIDGERSSMWSHMARIVGEVRPRFVFVENSPLLVGRGLARVLGDLAEMGYDARWGVLGAHHAAAPHKRDRIWILGYANRHGESAGAIEAEMERMQEYVADATGGEDDRRERGIVAEAERGGESVHASADIGGKDVGAAVGEGLEGYSGNVDGGDEPRRVGEEAAGSTGEAGLSQGKSNVANSEGFHAQGFENGSREIKFGGSGRWQPEPDVGRVAHGVAARVDRLRCIGNGQVPRVAALAWRILSKDARHSPNG